MTTASLSASDVRVRDGVLRELYWDAQVDASAIGITAKDGTVTLTGLVDTYAGKLAAERAAKRIRGVRAVANDIGVRPMLGRTDADIALDAAHVLRLSDTIPESVQATVHDGHISLTGNVDWLFQKRDADDVLRHVRGVRQVANHIVVQPAAVTRDLRQRIEKALHHNADIDARHITVLLAGSTVTLSGTVMSWQQREAAERAAASAPGICEVINQLAVVPRHDLLRETDIDDGT